MPATPTVSMCAFSSSERPPPEPRATATTFGLPGAASDTETSSPAAAHQSATARATSPSPGAPATSAGVIELIATRRAASSTRLVSIVMQVQEIALGLWRWTGMHPDWTPGDASPEGWEQEVGCVYYEAPAAVVLID